MLIGACNPMLWPIHHSWLWLDSPLQADIVGMMRDGNLLAEDAPETLLAQYSCMSLEEVFLLLCRGHGKFTVTEGQHIRKPVAHRLGTNPPSMITYQGPSPASKSQEGTAISTSFIHFRHYLFILGPCRASSSPHRPAPRHVAYSVCILCLHTLSAYSVCILCLHTLSDWMPIGAISSPSLC